MQVRPFHRGGSGWRCDRGLRGVAVRGSAHAAAAARGIHAGARRNRQRGVPRARACCHRRLLAAGVCLCVPGAQRHVQALTSYVPAALPHYLHRQADRVSHRC